MKRLFFTFMNALAFVIAICSIALTTVAKDRQPVALVVHPFEHKQVYQTGASGFTWYRWTLDESRSDNPQQALEWLFKDQNIQYIRNAFDQFSVSGAGKLQSTDRYDVGKADAITVTPTGDRYPKAEWQVETYQFELPNSRNMWVFNEAKKHNPQMKLMCYGHLIPKCFRKDNGNKNWQAWPINRALPGVEDYLAKWMFANLVNLKLNEGTDVDILDIYNEADAINFGGDVDAKWPVKIVQQRDAVAWLLHAIVPRLKEWVNDTGPTGRNRWQIKMPRIMAPSCVDTTNAANWLKFWHDHQSADTYDFPNAWANIDILSYHQYGGGYRERPYKIIDSIRGDRPVMQSEMHMGDDVLKNCPLPDVALEDDLQASLLLGHFLALSLNHGACVYDYYMGVSRLEKPESLLRFENRQFTRRKIYAAYRQLTNLQPRESHVVPFSLTEAPEGIDVVCYHHGDDRRVFVNLCNRTKDEQDIRLALQADRMCAITNVTTIQTSATQDMQTLESRPLAGDSFETIATLPGCSIVTLIVDFESDFKKRP